MKYFQLGLGTLANNLTNIEKLAIRTGCKKNIQIKMKIFLKNLTYLQENIKNGCLIIYQQAREQSPMK